MNAIAVANCTAEAARSTAFLQLWAMERSNSEYDHWSSGADNYVELHCGRNRSLVRCSMMELKAALDADDFVWIHRSPIVNVNRVAEVRTEAAGEYVIVMQGGERLESSRGYAETVRKLLRNSF